jgi:hypothetical protein
VVSLVAKWCQKPEILRSAKVSNLGVVNVGRSGVNLRKSGDALEYHLSQITSGWSQVSQIGFKKRESSNFRFVKGARRRSWISRSCSLGRLVAARTRPKSKSTLLHTKYKEIPAAKINRRRRCCKSDLLWFENQNTRFAFRFFDSQLTTPAAYWNSQTPHLQLPVAPKVHKIWIMERHFILPKILSFL